MCAIAGAFNCRKAAEYVYTMNHFMQHRAKGYAGIAASDGHKIYIRRGKGIINDVFKQKQLDVLHGKTAISHIRYPTVADDPNTSIITKAQPLLSEGVALAHNGNVYNYQDLFDLTKQPQKLKTKIDSELLLRLFCERKKLLPKNPSPQDLASTVWSAVQQARGSYCLAIISEDYMITVRDPSGNRPLCLGHKDNNGDGTAWFVASESCAFEGLEITYDREILPGEIIIFTKNGNFSFTACQNNQCLAQCIFENKYFSHPGSITFGEYNIAYRRRCGAKLCQDHPPLFSDRSKIIIAPVPDSAIEHGSGFADEGGYKIMPALHRNHYVGRTFIGANQFLRDLEVKRKFIGNRWCVEGKCVILIEDSIVRMTTMPPVVKLLRWLGAIRIEARIAAPPILHPCNYGIYIPTRQELCAANMTIKQIAEACGLDDLQYLTVNESKSLLTNPDDYCYYCMNGEEKL